MFNSHRFCGLRKYVRRFKYVRLRNGAHINNGVKGKKISSELFYKIRSNQPNVIIARLTHATKTAWDIWAV